MMPRLKSLSESSIASDSDRWHTALTFRTFGLSVGVRVNPAEILDGLPERLPFGWEPMELSEVDLLYSVEMEPGAPGEDEATARLWRDEEVLAGGSDLDHILHVLASDLKVYVAEWGKERIFLHAGVVGVGGNAILLPGYSMFGKTTLVTELVRAGATYYSDDFAVLDSRGMVHPFATPLQVREHDSVEQTDWTIDRLGGVAGTEPLPVGLVLLTRYRADALFRPRRVTPGRALLELLRYTPSRSRPLESIDTLEEVVRRAAVLKGARGDAEDAARAVLDRLVPKYVSPGP